METVTSEFLCRAYPKRHQWDRKGSHGKLLIIGGSRKYKGAPALAGMAALRAGADIVTIAAPESAADVIASFSPNLIVEPLVGDYVNTGNIAHLESLAERHDAVLIGNGLGRTHMTKDAVHEFLAHLRKPCIVDADALHLISEDKKLLRKGWIITPHAQEFFNLSGHRVYNSIDRRSKEAERFTKEFKATVLLKGYKDVIAEGTKLMVNSTGNPFMTVGGTGDVLAGICGALMAMGLNSMKAASASAYICGSAGDLARDETGPGMIATDVIEKIPDVLKSSGIEF
jgi:NAD(P)H-hydrate epimerase